MAFRSTIGGGPLDLRTVAFPQLLHLVPALNGGFRRADGASRSDIVGNLLPVVGAKVSTAEGVPLISISIDESYGLIM